MQIAERIRALEDELGPKRALALALHTQRLKRERRLQAAPGGLLHFIRYFWRVLEPDQPFKDGWALEAMCLHLEAVHRGDILRLLINISPGSMKSLLVNVFYPAWRWSAGGKPSASFLAFAYSSVLTERDNAKLLTLLQSREYRALWGHAFALTEQGKILVGNDKRGWKHASSVGGTSTGLRADCVLMDDPHAINDAESEVKRPNTCRWFKESMSNRLNNMDTSSIIVIMQRSHEADVAGMILDEMGGYVHLNVPLFFEPDARCVTMVKGREFWRDPRTIEDEVFWPERYNARGIEEILKLGEHVVVSQYQQRPEPRGGGLFKRAYWQDYGPHIKNGKFPSFDYIIGSLDSAFTEKEMNDPCGFSVWGCFRDPNGARSALLLTAWRKHLRLNGHCREKAKGEGWENYKQETGDKWGVVQWMRYEMARFKADHLLIENKANGHDIHNEIVRQSEHDPWSVELVDPKNLDKWARGMRVQPIFDEQMVWCIKSKAYAKLMIDDAASFPRGRFKDLVDSMTQVLWWLRKHGFLESASVLQVRRVNEARKAGKQRAPKALYPV